MPIAQRNVRRVREVRGFAGARVRHRRARLEPRRDECPGRVVVRGGFSSHARNTADAGAFVGVSTKSFESGQIFNRCAAANTGPSQYRRRRADISAGSFSGATATADAAAVDPDAIPREVRRASSFERRDRRRPFFRRCGETTTFSRRAFCSNNDDTFFTRHAHARGWSNSPRPGRTPDEAVPRDDTAPSTYWISSIFSSAQTHSDTSRLGPSEKTSRSGRPRCAVDNKPTRCPLKPPPPTPSTKTW